MIRSLHSRWLALLLALVCQAGRAPAAAAEAPRPAADKPSTDEMLQDSLDNALLQGPGYPRAARRRPVSRPQAGGHGLGPGSATAGPAGGRRRPRAIVTGSAGHHRPPDAAGRKLDQPPSDVAKDAARPAAGDRGLGAVDRGNEEAVPGRPRQFQVGGEVRRQAGQQGPRGQWRKRRCQPAGQGKRGTHRRAKRRTAKNWRGSSAC